MKLRAIASDAIVRTKVIHSYQTECANTRFAKKRDPANEVADAIYSFIQENVK